jgi:hypothetical protein
MRMCVCRSHADVRADDVDAGLFELAEDAAGAHGAAAVHGDEPGTREASVGEQRRRGRQRRRLAAAAAAGRRR